jgi:predicted DNA-binding transcriptional regulator YafY
MKNILDKLVEGCVPLKNMKLVSDLIANEKYHYVELHQKEYIQDKLWNIGTDIQERNLASIQYARANTPREIIKRIVEPVAILFSEYYFYLNAFIVELDDSGKYVHKYNYPTIFRIDRIKEYKHIGEKFRVAYANRFEEGEFNYWLSDRLLTLTKKYGR